MSSNLETKIKIALGKSAKLQATSKQDCARIMRHIEHYHEADTYKSAAALKIAIGDAEERDQHGIQGNINRLGALGKSLTKCRWDLIHAVRCYFSFYNEKEAIEIVLKKREDRDNEKNILNLEKKVVKKQCAIIKLEIAEKEIQIKRRKVVSDEDEDEPGGRGGGERHEDEEKGEEKEEKEGEEKGEEKEEEGERKEGEEKEGEGVGDEKKGEEKKGEGKKGEEKKGEEKKGEEKKEGEGTGDAEDEQEDEQEDEENYEEEDEEEDDGATKSESLDDTMHKDNDSPEKVNAYMENRKRNLEEFFEHGQRTMEDCSPKKKHNQAPRKPIPKETSPSYFQRAIGYVPQVVTGLVTAHRVYNQASELMNAISPQKPKQTMNNTEANTPN